MLCQKSYNFKGKSNSIFHLFFGDNVQDHVQYVCERKTKENQSLSMQYEKEKQLINYILRYRKVFILKMYKGALFIICSSTL